MRSRLLTLFLLLAPFAAQAGEPFDIPPAGVLRPKKAVASLYAPDLTSGARLKSDIAVDTAPSTAAATVPLPKPAPKAVKRAASAGYVRNAKRPPASLPSNTRPVAYVPPAEAEPAPAPEAQQSAGPAPAATSSTGSFFGNLFSAQPNPSGKRGLFTSAAETPAPQPRPFQYQRAPSQPSQLY